MNHAAKCELTQRMNYLESERLSQFKSTCKVRVQRKATVAPKACRTCQLITFDGPMVPE